MILLTRPIDESRDLQKALKEHNIESIIEPMLLIKSSASWEEKYRSLTKNAKPVLVFTSINAIKEFAKKQDNRNSKIVVVGEKSKNVACKLGFIDVIMADGNAKSLIPILMSFTKKELILYLSGSFVTIEISDILSNIGYNSHKIILYEAIKTPSIKNSTYELFRQKKITGVAMYSLRSAENFLRLVEEKKIDLSSTKLFAISEKIASKLRNLDWEAINVSNSIFNLMVSIS